jgi:hypothetical protein
MHSVKTEPIPVNRIQSLRLTCNRCRSALIIPLNAREIPGKCFNCYQPFPAENIQALLRELRHVRRELDDSKTQGYNISLEVNLDD